MNSFLEFDKKDAHQEKVLLLNIAKLEDLIILKSFFMEFDLRIEIFKSTKYFFRELDAYIFKLLF